jgi:hypothetical protein
MEDHLKIKQKAELKSEIDVDTYQKYNNNVISSFN